MNFEALPKNKYQWLAVTVSHFLVLMWERWLGKTDRVRASNSIDFALDCAEYIFCKAKEKFKKE